MSALTSLYCGSPCASSCTAFTTFTRFLPDLPPAQSSHDSVVVITGPLYQLSVSR